MKSNFLRLIVTFFLFPIVSKAQTNKTKILILGTPHLQQIEGFKPIMLDNVINKLDTFNFDVIAVEKMSGELLNDIKSRHDNSFDGITKGRFGAEFLKLADTVQTIKKITFLDAEKNILVLKNKKELTTSDRKELLFSFLATTDLPSAALQYMCINDKALFKSNFEKYIAGIIEKKIASHNEYYSLAASLAKREKINQLYPIDNLEDESLLFKYYPNFIKDYKDNSSPLNNLNELPIYQKLSQLTKESIQSNDLSELYSFFNSKAYKNQDYEGQWKIWLNTNFPSGSDLGRFSLWEMRNLQITANIMKVVSHNVGKKVLVIIGASHSGFIEKYLSNIEFVEVLKYE